MKILFWFDWDDTYLFEKIINNLHNKQKLNFSYCSLVTGPEYYEYYMNKYPEQKDNLYLTSQININMKNAVLDIKNIERIEKEYGQFIHRYILADRHMQHWNYEKSLLYIQESFKFIENIYNKEKFDMLIIRGTSACGLNSMLEYFCAEKNIPRYAITLTRLVESRIYISSDSFEYNFDIIDEFNKLIKKGLDVKEIELADYLIEEQRKKKVYWSKFNTKVNLKNFFKEIKGGVFKIYKYYKKNKLYKKYEEHSKVSILKKIIQKLEPKIKKMIYQKILKFDNIDIKNINYYYFPLQLTPEATTMTLAPSYLNQIALIEQLSHAIPGNSILIVKEHPAMLGMRKLSVYKKIRENYNVKLIGTYVSSKDLIKYSKAVITITGTAGLEAIFMRKPVITLGKTAYNYFPYVENIRCVRDMPKAIKRIKSYNWEKYNFYLRCFVLSIYKRSKSGFPYEPGLDYEQSLSDKNINTISKMLMEKIINYEQNKR